MHFVIQWDFKDQGWKLVEKENFKPNLANKWFHALFKHLITHKPLENIKAWANWILVEEVIWSTIKDANMTSLNTINHVGILAKVIYKENVIKIRISLNIMILYSKF